MVMEQYKIKQLIRKFIKSTYDEFTNIDFKVNKLMYCDENDIGSLSSFSGSTYGTINYKEKWIYEINLTYSQRSYLVRTNADKERIEDRITNTIQLMLGALLKTEKEDIKMTFSVAPNISYQPSNRVFGRY